MKSALDVEPDEIERRILAHADSAPSIWHLYSSTHLHSQLTVEVQAALERVELSHPTMVAELKRRDLAWRPSASEVGQLRTALSLTGYAHRMNIIEKLSIDQYAHLQSWLRGILTAPPSFLE